MKLPLQGIRVIEFAHMVMGPTCGLILADLGAEVIKVEPVEGDNTRRLTGSGAGFFPAFNRNKKSLAIDIRDAQAKAACYQILGSVLPDAGMAFAWCRLFYLHGEGENPARLVPYLCERLAAGEPALLSSGRQIRDFLDVRIAGQLLARAALSDVTGPVNICSGRGVTVAELATAIAEEYGRVDLLRFGARPDNLTDPPCVIGEPTVI